MSFVNLQSIRSSSHVWLFSLMLIMSGCVPTIDKASPNREMPEAFKGAEKISEHPKVAIVKWREYFEDPNLLKLIDLALEKNQEINIFLQEIKIAKNEALAKSGAYLPSVEIGAEAGLDKVGKYTRFGAVEENLEIEKGKEFPDPLPNFLIGAHANWEVDIWHKLRDAEKSAITNYLATQEGKNFIVTNLIAEIASSYFELLALDNQLNLVNENVEIQSNAFEVVKLKKQSAKVTELALRRFEAQLLNTKSLKYEVQQKIIETENKINFLVGRYPQPIERNAAGFIHLAPKAISVGIPAELLENRPDLRQAELELAAAELDIGVAKANFYPSLRISGDIGYEAYKASKIIESPESFLYSIGAGLTAPLINRREIEAMYNNANAKQVQAVINYERTLLKAVIEVTNQLGKISNLTNSFSFKEKQVQALHDSVQISNVLFVSARADYMEVLMTQRDALESRFELIDVKIRQLNAAVNMYRALGGGWS